MNVYLLSRLLESGFTSWALHGGDTERLHACMGSPIYNEEAEVDHRCLITLNIMCLATTAKCAKTLAEPCCLKVGGS